MSTLLDSILSNIHLPADPARAPRGLGKLARQAVTAVLEHAQRRRELRQLLEMDDRALKDIGLTRVDALQFARGPVSRSPHNRVTAANPLRVTPEIIEYYKRRALELRAQAVADLAGRAVAYVRGWRIASDRDLDRAA